MKTERKTGKTEVYSQKEKRHQLYLKQKELLDTFLAHGTITHLQYEKSLHDLTVKMGEEGPAEAESCIR